MKTIELEDFIRYAKERFDCEITIKKSEKPDSFEDLFGTSFLVVQDVTDVLVSDESVLCYENSTVEVNVDFDGEMAVLNCNVEQAA